MKIMIIEDDKKIQKELSSFLTSNGYDTYVIEDYKNIAKNPNVMQADLILLDLTLPGVDGLYLCREIRAKSYIPIIILTSRATEVDELLGLSYGADDFITKPYSLSVLLKRIELALRKAQGEHQNRIAYNDIFLNLSTAMIEAKEQNVELSRNELRIFYLLLINRGEIVAKEKIMDDLWENELFVDENTLFVNINRLRTRLCQVGYDDVIVTKRMQGYMLK